MKNLSDTIKKLPNQHIKEIRKILDIKKASGNSANSIHSALLSYSGINRLISCLDIDKRKILHSVCTEKNGVTFEELSKKYRMDYELIETKTNDLANKLLVYVLKNRQKLSNKLDKVYLIPEIREILSPMEENFINDYFLDIYQTLEKRELSKYKPVLDTIKKNASVKLIEKIFSSGGIIFLEELDSLAGQGISEKAFLNLAEKKIIRILHDLTGSGKTLIILDKKVFIALAMNSAKKPDSPVNIHNRYTLLLNLLRSYDTISTYGLFLTKQRVFRKIDKKHLEDSVLKLSCMEGTELSRSVTSQLALHILYLQNCIVIRNDTALISLKKIRELLSDPNEWLFRIIKLLDGQPAGEKLLRVPFDVPSYETLFSMMDLLYHNDNSAYDYIKAAFLAKQYSEIQSDRIIDIRQITGFSIKEFDTCLNFLCIAGIIEISNKQIKISDIGSDIAKKLGIEDIELADETAGSPEQAVKETRSIYLNPDFTMIIPKNEIPSEALYHILTHTEIIKDDVILHTRICRESILTSLKRGMDNENFFSSLKMYLKTEIPNNLNFLISEWINQTIRLKIFNATVIKSNPSFLDKITHSKIKNSIKKRISDQYAILDMKYMDKFIKMAKENDALINLFDESEEDD